MTLACGFSAVAIRTANDTLGYLRFDRSPCAPLLRHKGDGVPLLAGDVVQLQDQDIGLPTVYARMRRQVLKQPDLVRVGFLRVSRSNLASDRYSISRVVVACFSVTTGLAVAVQAVRLGPVLVELGQVLGLVALTADFHTSSGGRSRTRIFCRNSTTHCQLCYPGKWAGLTTLPEEQRQPL